MTVGPTEAPPVRISSVNASPVPGEVGAPVRFESAAQGTSLTYQWDFGDGTVGSGPAPTHRYEAQGRYTARLEVSGQARYRVVVGRFESLGAAQRAVSRHESKFPFDSWMVLAP